jgi:N-acetylglucosamine-6-sulfatase
MLIRVAMPNATGARTRAWWGAAICVVAATPALVLGSSQPGEAAQHGTPSPRNVLVVMTDDQTVADMVAVPATRRRIGGHGVTFRESFAGFPFCCPSRATYLTGQYAHNHGVRDNGPPNGGAAAFDDSETTAVALDAAGYRTGLIGKYLNGYAPLAHQKVPYIPPGYDDWRAITRNLMFDWEQLQNGTFVRWGSHDREYQTDVLARQAERFIESAAETATPFFLTVTPLAPHVETRSFVPRHNPRPAPRHRNAFADEPLAKPLSFNEKDVSDKPAAIQAIPRFDAARRQHLRDLNRDRRTSLLAVDELVVRLVKALRSTGALNDTLIIFTSDNGYLLGEHRRAGKDAFYEPALRVPLMIRAPGLPDGVVVESPVVNTDLAATIYDFTRVDPLLVQDGVSLFEVIASPTSFDDRELPLQTRSGIGIRAPEWTYAKHGTGPAAEFELYDLESDSDQLNSLHADPAYDDERDALANRLNALRDCQGPQCY